MGVEAPDSYPALPTPYPQKRELKLDKEERGDEGDWLAHPCARPFGLRCAHRQFASGELVEPEPFGLGKRVFGSCGLQVLIRALQTHIHKKGS